MEISSRTLLDLRSGVELRVQLKSGRVVKGRLLCSPGIRTVGKPGIHRVRLLVLDVEGARHIPDSAPIWAVNDYKHNISGDRVLEIL